MVHAVQILGGNLGLSATLPAGCPAIDAGVSLTGPAGNVISRDLHDSIFTVGDPVIAATVDWHAGNLRLGDFKGRTIALGGTAAYTFKLDGRDITTRVKVLREFDVKNRLEGTAGFLTVSFPIVVSAVPAKPLVTKY